MRPASSPRVTYGSGIGSHARATCGIWTRWSISASPCSPAASAAAATSTSQPAGSSPHGNRDSWSTSRGPSAARSAVRTGAGSGALTAASSTTCTTSQPSAATSATTSRTRASCRASAGAGTGRSRRALRSRHTAAGVSTQHEDGRHGVGAGEVEQRAPARGVEPEGVDHRGQASSHPGGDHLVEHREGVVGGVEVGRAAADHPAQRVRRDDLDRPVPRRGPVRLAGARGAHQDDERRVGEAVRSLHAPILPAPRRPTRG